MNLYESIKNNIKESEEFYAKCIKNGTDINTEYFNSQSEAEQFAEKAVKNNDYDEVDVYKASNDDCVGIYDKNDFNESDSKEERIKWLEDALVSVYSYGIRSCVIDNIVPGLTNKDSYASLSDEYKKLTGKDFNIKEHIKNESELKEDEEPKITAYSIAEFEADRLHGKAYKVDNSDSLTKRDVAGFTFNFKDRNYSCQVSLTERGSAVKESDEGERVDLFLRNDYGDWIDYLWYYPSTGKFFATFETVSHAEAWKRLNDPQVKQAVNDSWGDDTEKVYKEMINYLKSCDDLKESELKESYDLVNVVEDAQSSIKNLINNLQKNGDTVQTSVVIDALNSILKDIEKNSEEAW